MGDRDLFPQLDELDRALLIDLLQGHRNEVLDDQYTGYDGSKQDRLDHVAELLGKLGAE
jgi:hypothetical protein